MIARAPASWARVPLKRLLVERDERGHVKREVLSVYRDHGVVPKTSRSDNFNKTPEDLSLYKSVDVGDLVVNKMKAWQGSLAVSDHEGIVSGDYLVCRLADGAPVHGRFLHYLLRSSNCVAEMHSRSSGIRPSQWRLYWEDLREITVALPPVAEQRATADFLDVETMRIDGVVDARRRSLTSLQRLRTGIIEAGVAGRLLDVDRAVSRLAWLDTIPVGWQEVKLKLVAQLGSGHTPSRAHPEWWVPEECIIPWITTGEVAQMRSDRIEQITATRERISPVGLTNSSAELCPSGTVVLCRTAASSGYSAIMGTEMATSQDFATWVCGPSLRPRFLLLCLRAMRTDLLGRLAMGSTHKTIYMPDIESIRIPLPPTDEQDHIVADVHRRLVSIDTAAERIERQIALLQERRQALTSAAVTGQLDVSKGAA